MGAVYPVYLIGLGIRLEQADLSDVYGVVKSVEMSAGKLFKPCFYCHSAKS